MYLTNSSLFHQNSDLHLKWRKCIALYVTVKHSGLAITYNLQEIGALICKYVLSENAFKPAFTYKLLEIEFLICNQSLQKDVFKPTITY